MSHKNQCGFKFDFELFIYNSMGKKNQITLFYSEIRKISIQFSSTSVATQRICLIIKKSQLNCLIINKIKFNDNYK